MKNKWLMPLVCFMWVWIFFNDHYVNFDNVLQIKLGDTCITVYGNGRGTGQECFDTKRECVARFNEIWKMIIADSRHPEIYLAVPKEQQTPLSTVEGETEYDWQN